VPASAENQTYSIKTTCSDAETTVTGTFNLIINDLPQNPNAIPTQTAVANRAFSYTIPDNIFSDFNTLTLSTTGLPGTIAFDPATGTFTGTPTDAANTTYTVTVTATDSHGQTVAEVFDINVVANSPPVFTTTYTLAAN
jgi:hypothetical protein